MPDTGRHMLMVTWATSGKRLQFGRARAEAKSLAETCAVWSHKPTATEVHFNGDEAPTLRNIADPLEGPEKTTCWIFDCDVPAS